MAISLKSSEYLRFAYQLYEEIDTNEINLMYEGAVTQETALTFTAMTEQNLERLDEPNNVRRKVFNVVVEMVQNISRHADLLTDDPNEARRGIISISHNESDYHIVTGNIVKSDKTPKLKSKLDVINEQDKAGLTEMYKKQIREGEISERGGAGLGFIDIAKKSGNHVRYKFFEISPDYTFFMVIATVKRA